MLMNAKSHTEPQNRDVLISSVTSIEVSMGWTLLEWREPCFEGDPRMLLLFGGKSSSSSIPNGPAQLLGHCGAN